MMHMTTGTRIRQARQARDLTQEQFARAAGVTLITVSRWERDKNRPFPRQLPAIAEALGLTPEDLQEDEEPAALRSTADPFAVAFRAAVRSALSEEIAALRLELLATVSA